MHVMQKQTDACDEIMIFGVHGWSFKSFSLIKSWVQNRVSTYTWFFEPHTLGKLMLLI